MRVVRVVSSVVVAVLLVGLPKGRARAQSAEAFFDDTVLHEVRLAVSSRDLRQMREEYDRTFTVPADFIWGETRIRNVGIQTRGSGSRNPVKLGFDVSFDRYTAGQEFFGLKKLVLDNLWQDPSLFREHLAMAAFRRLGQAAPRESFARLYINNEFQGVYGLVEPIDARFITRTTGETTGRLFEFRYAMPFFGQYLGEELEPYQPLFAPRAGANDTDWAMYGPIRDLFREANAIDDPDWRSHVDALIDLPQLVTHVAIQGCMAEIDGFMGYAGLNNFYLYRFADSTRHRVFPWDEDLALWATDMSILRRGDEKVAFIDRALAEPDLRALFLDVAETCARRLDEEAWLATEIERLVGLVGPSILEDPRKQFSNAGFMAEVEVLRGFAATRPAVVLSEVATLR